MKKIVMSLVSLLVIGTSTGFCKTNVSVKNFNGSQPRTEQVVKTTTSNRVSDVKTSDKNVVSKTNKDTKITCKGLKTTTPETKKVTEQVKKQETKKCTCKECQKKQKKQVTKVTKVSKVNTKNHTQVRM